MLLQLILIASLLMGCQPTPQPTPRATPRATPTPAPRLPTVIATIASTGRDNRSIMAFNHQTEEIYLLRGAGLTILKGTEKQQDIKTEQILTSGIAVDEVNNRLYITLRIYSVTQ